MCGRVLKPTYVPLVVAITSVSLPLLPFGCVAPKPGGDRAPAADSAASTGEPSEDTGRDGAAINEDSADAGPWKSGATKSLSAYWNFEDAPDSGWWFAGNAGYDIDTGFAHSGKDNVWVNASDPSIWNAVNTEFYAAQSDAGAGYCNVSAWIQTSPNFVGGELDLWEDRSAGNLRFLNRSALSANTRYTEVTIEDVDVSAAILDAKKVLLVFGFWGSGTVQWLRVDDVAVTCYVYDATD
jgi:hypothetical protein